LIEVKCYPHQFPDADGPEPEMYPQPCGAPDAGDIPVLVVVFCFILPFKVDLSAFDLIVAACSLKNVHWVALVGLSHDIFKRFHYFDHHGQIFHVKERVIDIYDPLGPLMFRDFEATFAALWT
jgi:hypothetical protein